MTTVATPATTTYNIDKAHSDVAFDVRHLLGRVRGAFTEFDGTITFDPALPAEASVDFRIQADSVSTNQKDRDAHLRSADFFDAEAHPTLTFVSRSVTPVGHGAYDVTGDLTVRGVTKRIILPVRYLGVATDPWGNQKLAFEAETTLNRKEFGLTWNAVLETGGFMVGDDVRVTLSVQAVAAEGV
jgi:polyisoprenoid-binding protein YceI